MQQKNEQTSSNLTEQIKQNIIDAINTGKLGELTNIPRNKIMIRTILERMKKDATETTRANKPTT